MSNTAEEPLDQSPKGQPALKRYSGHSDSSIGIVSLTVSDNNGNDTPGATPESTPSAPSAADEDGKPIERVVKEKLQEPPKSDAALKGKIGVGEPRRSKIGIKVKTKDITGPAIKKSSKKPSEESPAHKVCKPTPVYNRKFRPYVLNHLRISLMNLLGFSPPAQSRHKKEKNQKERTKPIITEERKLDSSSKSKSRHRKKCRVCCRLL